MSWSDVAEHFKRCWKYWLGSVGLVVLFFKLYDLIKSPLYLWVQKQIVPPEGKVATGYSVRDIVPTSMAFTVILFSLVLVALLITSLALFRNRKADSMRSLLSKTFHRTMQAADLISKQLFPGSEAPIKKVVSYRQVYAIYENGDCS